MTEIGKSGRPLSAPVQKFFSIFLNSGDEKNGRRSILILRSKKWECRTEIPSGTTFYRVFCIFAEKKIAKISNSHGNGKGGSRTKIDFYVFLT